MYWLKPLIYLTVLYLLQEGFVEAETIYSIYLVSPSKEEKQYRRKTAVRLECSLSTHKLRTGKSNSATRPQKRPEFSCDSSCF